MLVVGLDPNNPSDWVDALNALISRRPSLKPGEHWSG